MPQRVGSCGLPVPGAMIRIASLDDPKVVLPPGEIGELCIKGPNVMLGYWKNPEATAQVFDADGYLRTGDVAFMDADGWIHIVDRTKDMLLCSGYNVYPRVIEEAIYTHPSVNEACVIGVPDTYRGQSPKAFITLKAGAAEIGLEEMKAFLADKLGKHEMIGVLEIRAELPKTPVGKIAKKALVDEEAARRAPAAKA
jgi:long-chain acyl-CoA synthetase